MAQPFNQESSFNEAILKMQRIHTSQEIINEVRINLLAFNHGYGKYNYEVMNACVISLCSEVGPLMKKEELKQFKDLRSMTEEFLFYNPIHHNSNNTTFSKRKNVKKINQENFKKFKELMFFFEDFARKQVDLHGLSAPKKKDRKSSVTDL
jgi:hypothetical protein